MRRVVTFFAVVAVVAAMAVAPAAGVGAPATQSRAGSYLERWSGRTSLTGETKAGSSPAGQRSASSVVGGSDPVGDPVPVAICNGDITSFGGDYEYNTIAFWAVTACGSNPVTAPNWANVASAIIWSLDVNGDGVADYAAFFSNDGGLAAPVFHVANSDFTQVCSGTPNWDGNAAFSSTFAPSCIGNPAAVRISVYMLWNENPGGPNCACPTDFAPDFGWSASILRPPPLANWYLRNSVTPGAADTVVAYGLRSYQPVVGDWDGNDSSTIGVYVGGSWYLRNSNTSGPPDVAVNYGTAAYTPVVGDWNGDHTDTIGAYLNGSWYLRNSNTPGAPDVVANYGAPGYTPVVGDWDGNGTTTIGEYVNGSWYLRNSNTPGAPDVVVNYGAPGYTPVVGDWDGNGTVTIGVYFNGFWYLRNSNTPGPPDVITNYGAPGYTPVVGNWDGVGGDSIGEIG